jgi:hypothetical protein
VTGTMTARATTTISPSVTVTTSGSASPSVTVSASGSASPSVTLSASGSASPSLTATVSLSPSFTGLAIPINTTTNNHSIRVEDISEEHSSAYKYPLLELPPLNFNRPINRIY